MLLTLYRLEIGISCYIVGQHRIYPCLRSTFVHTWYSRFVQTVRQVRIECHLWLLKRRTHTKQFRVPHIRLESLVLQTNIFMDLYQWSPRKIKKCCLSVCNAFPERLRKTAGRNLWNFKFEHKTTNIIYKFGENGTSIKYISLINKLGTQAFAQLHLNGR